MMATVPTPRNRNQRGATLVVALILLALMTVMGVFAARSAIFQEKSSANDFDRSLAMQAAEIALRDAEKDIQGLGFDGTPCAGGNCRAAALYVDGLLTNNFVLACTSGLCEGDADVPATAHVAAKPWVDIADIWTNNAKSVRYGTFTAGPPAITNLVGQPPRYIIEKFTRNYEGVDRPVYRISALGFGRSANTQVLLQSVFVPQ
jgi:type IV pilus assembly protein PilX